MFRICAFLDSMFRAQSPVFQDDVKQNQGVWEEQIAVSQEWLAVSDQGIWTWCGQDTWLELRCPLKAHVLETWLLCQLVDFWQVIGSWGLWLNDYSLNGFIVFITSGANRVLGGNRILKVFPQKVFLVPNLFLSLHFSATMKWAASSVTYSCCHDVLSYRGPLEWRQLTMNWYQEPKTEQATKIPFFL